MDKLTEKVLLLYQDKKILILLILSLLLLLLLFFLCRRLQRKARHRRIRKRMLEIGKEAEEEILQEILRLPGYKKVLANAYLPSTRSGSTTEVDLILISRHGIFVLESKGYSGWIFGEKDSRNWLRTQPNGSSLQFYNPIMQNRGHVHAIQKYLGLEEKRPGHLLKSIVVFSDRCTLKKVDARGSGAQVINKRHLRRALWRASWGSWFCLSRRQIRQFYNKLLPRTRVSAATKQRHILEVKKKAGR